MPYEVNQILTGLNDPVTAAPEESLQMALDRMLHYQYSQLPVIKGSGQSRQFYFITYERILRALHDFGSKINNSNLRVGDALMRIPNVYRSSDNLFELLAGIRETNAALIVDDDNNLTHVVTAYDTTQYFRQWAEDIMHARDVENSLKQFITYAFKKSNGEIDDEARQRAIEELTSSNKDLRKKFGKALDQYLSQLAVNNLTLNNEWAGRAFIEYLNHFETARIEDYGDSNNESTTVEEVAAAAAAAAVIPDTAAEKLSEGQNLQKHFNNALVAYLRQQAESNEFIDQSLFEAAFLVLYNTKEKVRKFNELTLDTYIRLFLHEQCWNRCSDAVGKEKEAINCMLEGVRDTRNKLAHFREEEITTQQRLQLQTCADWLGELEKPIRTAFETSAPDVLNDSVDKTTGVS